MKRALEKIKKTLEAALEQAKLIVWVISPIVPIIPPNFVWDWGRIALSCLIHSTLMGVNGDVNVNRRIDSPNFIWYGMIIMAAANGIPKLASVPVAASSEMLVFRVHAKLKPLS